MFIAGRGSARRVDAIVSVAGLDAAGDYAVAPLGLEPDQFAEGD